MTRAPLRRALWASSTTRAAAALAAPACASSRGGSSNSFAIRSMAPGSNRGPRRMRASWTGQNPPVVSAAYSASSAVGTASSLPLIGRCRKT